jgi:hypothetical protein
MLFDEFRVGEDSLLRIGSRVIVESSHPAPLRVFAARFAPDPPIVLHGSI